MINIQDKIFYLCGKEYSYAMYVSGMGFLQHAYYGKKTDFETVRRIRHLHHGDFREPSVILEQADGATISRFRYVSHKLKYGIAEIKGMPYARGAGETLACGTGACAVAVAAVWNGYAKRGEEILDYRNGEKRFPDGERPNGVRRRSGNRVETGEVKVWQSTFL